MGTETQPTTPTTTTAPPPVVTAPVTPPAPVTPETPKPGDGATTKAPVTPTSPLGGTPEDKGGKPEGEKPNAEELQLKFPEGFKENTELMGQFKTLAKETGLKSESAQKLVDLYVKNVQAQQEQGNAAVSEQVKKWEEANKADKEIGGADYAANLAMANRLINKFGDADVKAFLQLPAVGNHPGVQRMLVKIAKAFGEDFVSVAPTGRPSKPTSDDEFLRTMYPTHFKDSQQ